MSHRKYTISKGGKSDGNTITTGFTIDVERMDYLDNGNDSQLAIDVLTRGKSGRVCNNDDIPLRIVYDLPEMKGVDADLAATFEGTLDDKYGKGNWS